MPTAQKFICSATALLLAATALVSCGKKQEDVSLEELFKDKTLPRSAPTMPAADSVGDDQACTHVDEPMSDIAAKKAAEPRLRLPQPAGWTHDTRYESEVARYVLINPDLIAHKFAPNIVVTLEPTPTSDPNVIFEQQRANLVNLGGAKNLTSTPGTLCGLDSQRFTYTADPTGPAMAERAVTALAVVTTVSGQSYLVTATVQTSDPANATYQRDSKTLLDGLQVLDSTTH